MTHYGRDSSDSLSTNSRPINNSNIYNYNNAMQIGDTYANNDIDDMASKNSVEWTQCEMLDGGFYNQNYPPLDDYITNHFDTDVPDTNAGVATSTDYGDRNISTTNDFECSYNAEYGYRYRYGTQQNSTAKVLPFVSQTDRDDFMVRKIEGTYDGERENRFSVRLPAAPATAVTPSRYRMLPQAVTYENVHDSEYNNINGDHTRCAPNAGLIDDERIGSFISLSVAAPLRMLPQTHSRTRSSQQLFQDSNFGSNNIMTMSGDAAGNQEVSYCSTPDVAATRTSNYEDVFCQMGRPYTSMLPLDYAEYPDYGGFHLDNLSTYSDTPPMSNAQHKLQQQRKISLMMAMTTASVIASGETRVPVVHQQSESQCQQRINSYPITSTTSASASVSYLDTNMENSYSSTVSSVTSSSPTTRKLPKRLPSPQYKKSSSMYAADITLPTQPLMLTNTALILPQSDKTYRPKQLPKLPMGKTISSSVPITSSFVANNDKLKPSSTAHENHIMIPISIKPTSSLSSPDNVVRLKKEPKQEDEEEGYEKDEESDKTISIFSSEQQLKDGSPNKSSLNLHITPPPSLCDAIEYVESSNSKNDLLHSPRRASIKLSVTKTDSQHDPETKTISTSSTTFNMSEYLKPYTLDPIQLRTDNQNGYIPTVISTTNNTQVSLNSDKDQSLGSLKFFLPSSSLESHITPPYSITTWTSSPNYTESYHVASAAAVVFTLPQQSPSASRSEIVITPLSDSSSSLSYLISKPTTTDEDKMSAPLQIGAKSDFKEKVISPVYMNNITNVFTTTVHASDPILTNLSMSTSIIDNQNKTEIATPSTLTEPTQSYVDYMKKFDLPELPPILNIDYSSNIQPITELVPETTTAQLDTTTISFDLISKLNNNTSSSTLAISTNPSTVTTKTLNAIAPSSQILDDSNEHNEFKVTSTCQFNHNQITPSTNNSSLDIVESVFNHELTSEIMFQSEILPEYVSSKAIEPPSSILVITSSAFDDSFYDSFNVDLTALTATIAQIETETFPTTVLQTAYDKGNAIQNYEICDTHTNSNTQMKQPSYSATVTGKSLGEYYKPYDQESLVVGDVFLPAGQKAKVTSAATSVLDGLSKGIKGGLDGVLSGVSSTIECNKQNTINENKKSFGFGLASKLVPSVGGLLSSSHKSEQEVIVAISSSMSTADNGLLDGTISKDTTTTTTSCENEFEFENTPVTSSEYLSRSPLSHHNEGLTHFDSFSSARTKSDFDYHSFSEDPMGIKNRIESVGFDHEFDYSEYPANQISGIQYSCFSNIYNDSNKTIATMSKDISDSTSGFAQIHPGLPESSTDKSRNSVSTTTAASKKPTSIKKVGTSTGSSTAGGMFGNIFGKAAAAVQSATYAVNQSASSVASAVVQKTSVPSNKTLSVFTDFSTISAAGNIVNSDITFSSKDEEYHSIKNLENDYNSLLINQQESLPNQYISTTNSDDYTNCNTHELGYEMSVPTTVPIVNRNDNIYYSDVNLRHQNDIVVMAAGQKMLPTVPSAGSTGKKLPTINGKSGLLIKQQPTEIIDDESDEDIINDFLMHRESDKLLSHEPNNCIDSEQDDYYMDHQQTTPSSRRPGDYYEHVSTGYDFREDFFNEEDEYKYLEQQRQQQQYQNQDQPHQQRVIGNQKQTSLNYIDDRQDDDFIDENYQSDEDDCGNYLDESSSGSVAVTDKRKPLVISNSNTTSSVGINDGFKVGLHTIAVTHNSPKLTGSHQQIKKQDSIIVDEAESKLTDSDDYHRVSVNILPDKADDGDQLSDLAPSRTKSQKKKMLVRGETEEVVSGHMQIIRKPEITAKQRWHWAYNKIIMQLNVSTNHVKLSI